MATFLGLCTNFTVLSGLIPTAPAAVTGQTGQALKVVTWVKLAWELIQNSSSDWSWMKAEVSSVALTISQMTYTATQLGVSSRFGEWRGERFTPPGRLHRPWTIWDNSIGQSDETELHEIDYDQWRLSYDRGTHDANRPIVYAFAPDQTVRFGPTPDKAYRVRGEYRKSVQTLAADGDTPEMPSRFHDLITFRAILLANEQGESVAGIAYADREYHRLLADLSRDCLPAISAHGVYAIA